MAIKKSELYSSLWSSCDELRGGMDASQIPAADIVALARFWAVCPQLRATHFKPGRPGYLDLAVDKQGMMQELLIGRIRLV